jgi:wyosine [tRNA(Phe)-imidazoG37] synthetase (radical SAM superfamily)
MSTFLFDSIIFGPVWSRRLGESLGINLLPANRKTCNYNCVYCECGLTPKTASGASGFPSRSLVEQELRAKLSGMRSEGQYLDSITFAGNGEPTLHPLFPAILDDVIRLRDEFFPLCHVSVLSNATMIESEDVFKALLKADINILKLDSAIEETVSKINCPPAGFSLPGLLKNLKLFNGKLTIQTLFFRGIHNGEKIDNSSEKEVKAWIEALKAINPVNVMIYTLARDTAVGGLESLSPEELKTIALQVEKAGISTQVSP